MNVAWETCSTKSSLKKINKQIIHLLARRKKNHKKNLNINMNSMSNKRKITRKRIITWKRKYKKRKKMWTSAAFTRKSSKCTGHKIKRNVCSKGNNTTKNSSANTDKTMTALRLEGFLPANQLAEHTISAVELPSRQPTLSDQKKEVLS